jgi:DNA invertase Pin-like site-specific DNA recombinase
MLAELQPLGISVVLVYDLDRAMRKLKYQLQLKDELDARRVILISLADGVIDTSTPEGILRFLAKGMVNEYQANTTARKVRDNLAYKAKHGGWVGQWPIGYEKDNQGRLVPSADASVVPLSFELYASGAYTDSTLADQLNARGYQTIDTKLISAELWAARQAIREERTRTHGSPIMTEAGWLSGAVWCEECKQKVWHQKSGRQAALRYYRCSGINKRVARRRWRVPRRWRTRCSTSWGC